MRLVKLKELPRSIVGKREDGEAPGRAVVEVNKTVNVLDGVRVLIAEQNADLASRDRNVQIGIV